MAETLVRGAGEAQQTGRPSRIHLHVSTAGRVDEFRISRELEGLDAMRGKTMSPPYPLHGTWADADDFRHDTSSPTSDFVGWLGTAELNDAVNLVLTQSDLVH
jgi:hypothetical protein